MINSHSLANCRTESNEFKSNFRQKISSLPVSVIISCRARSHFSVSRHAMYMRAPRLAKSKTVSLPMPVLQPVTITTLPSHRTLSLVNRAPSMYCL